MRRVRLRTRVHRFGERLNVSVNPEVRSLVWLFFARHPRIRRHLGASPEVYPAEACDRNQKFKLSGRK